MKRLHVHVAVNDIAQSIGFYSALFAARPAVVKSDYAKWMLDDPRVNFAISTRGRKAGLDHLGIQVEDLLLGEIPFQLDGYDPFLKLFDKAAHEVLGALFEEVFGQLLGDGATSAVTA